MFQMEELKERKNFKERIYFENNIHRVSYNI